MSVRHSILINHFLQVGHAQKAISPRAARHHQNFPRFGHWARTVDILWWGMALSKHMWSGWDGMFEKVLRGFFWLLNSPFSLIFYALILTVKEKVRMIAEPISNNLEWVQGRILKSMVWYMKSWVMTDDRWSLREYRVTDTEPHESRSRSRWKAQVGDWDENLITFPFTYNSSLTLSFRDKKIRSRCGLIRLICRHEFICSESESELGNGWELRMLRNGSGWGNKP